MSNGQWIGDRAVEAVMALSGEKQQMQVQMQQIAELLTKVGVPNVQEGPAGTKRPLMLVERVQILINEVAAHVNRDQPGMTAPPGVTIPAES